MKFSEDQMLHFKPSILVKSRGSPSDVISAYQHLLDFIIQQIVNSKELLLGKKFCVNLSRMEKNAANKVVEEVVSQFIQSTESEILIMNEWNFELGNGSDILDMVLKLSN